MALSYRSSNLPPEISKLEVPDLSAADGTSRQTRLNVKWEVSDPNDDEMNYTVQIRKDGWPSWIPLMETPITEKTYAWDTTAFPSGYYRVKLTASDRPSNSPDDALEPRPGKPVVHRRSRAPPGDRDPAREEGPDRAGRRL